MLLIYTYWEAHFLNLFKAVSMCVTRTNRNTMTVIWEESAYPDSYYSRKNMSSSLSRRMMEAELFHLPPLCKGFFPLFYGMTVIFLSSTFLQNLSQSALEAELYVHFYPGLNIWVVIFSLKSYFTFLKYVCFNNVPFKLICAFKCQKLG